jgi:enamine deaminase RidA (YjgF/YER057c/UK114 family)
MQLVAGGARAQLRKSLRSTARVLAACGSALPLAISAVLYVAEAAAKTPDGGIVALTELVATWCAGRQLGSAPARARVRQRADVGSDKNEGSDSENEFENISADDAKNEVEEDSECEAERMFPLGDSAIFATRRSRTAQTEPLVLTLVVPALPRGALVEFEVIAATRAAAAESGGLHTQASAKETTMAPRLITAKASSVAIPSCLWSCTAAAWQPSAGNDEGTEGLVAALLEQAHRCGLGATCVSSTPFRIRLLVTQDLFAANLKMQIMASLRAATVSVVPVLHFVLGSQEGGKVPTLIFQRGIVAIFFRF